MSSQPYVGMPHKMEATPRHDLAADWDFKQEFEITKTFSVYNLYYFYTYTCSTRIFIVHLPDVQMNDPAMDALVVGIHWLFDEIIQPTHCVHSTCDKK